MLCTILNKKCKEKLRIIRIIEIKSSKTREVAFTMHFIRLQSADHLALITCESDHPVLVNKDGPFITLL